MCSVFISGLLALVVVFYVDNFSRAVSFIALSIIWLFTCWKGYRAAVKRNFEDHRKLMIRSFGITLVAVSARMVVPLLLLIYSIKISGILIPDPTGRNMPRFSSVAV